MFAWKRIPQLGCAGGLCELLEARQLLTAAPWQQADIGSVGAAGLTTVSDTTLTLTGAGLALGTDNDAGHFTYLPLTGDGEIDSQVASFSAGTGSGLIGLVIRSNLTTYSPEVAVEWTAGSTVQYEQRLTSGAWANNSAPFAAMAAPVWLRLVREGQQLSAYESTDGSSWITVGSDTVNLGVSAYIGIFIGGGAASVSASATLQNVYVGAVSQPFTTSWVGNTFGGGDQFVQDEIDAMYVMPNGTVYTDSVWDEGGHEAGIYQNGQMIGALQDTHVWGRTGGAAVTSDGTYVYLAMEQEPVYGAGSAYPAAGTDWYAVRRYHLDGSLAPFPGGNGWDGDMLVVSTSNPVTGLAVTNGTLLVSDAGDGTVQAYSTATMTQTATWALTNAGEITTDSQGTAWIIQNAGGVVAAPRVVHFGVGGSLLPGAITGLGDPVALAMNNAGQLLVTDDGPAKRVYSYSLGTTPMQVASFGDLGGLYSGVPGAVTPTKFDGLAGVGVDAAGNLYVSTSAHGATVRSFSPVGQQNWEIDGLEYVDVADADPASNGTAVYTPFHEYAVDYSQTAGQQWTLTATTIDPTNYPEDPRLITTDGGIGLTSVMMRRINGSLFMFMSDSLSRFLVVYRFVDDIAVPAAMFSRGPTPLIPNSPTSGAWIWTDSNGDGAFQANEFQSMGAEDENRWGISVDANGNVWFASSSNGVSEVRHGGLDANGVPQYTATNQSDWAAPAIFTELTRAIYDPSSDTLFLTGYTAAAPHTGSEWGAVGTTVVRYNNWSTTPSLQWQVNLPYAPNASPPVFAKSLNIVGDRLFAGISHTAQILQYDTNTAAQLGTLYPGPEVAGQSGWFDTSNAINAIQRANGQIVVFAEEVVQGKVMMYEMSEAAPQSLTATATGNGAKLTWTAVTGAVGYDIERSTDGIHYTLLTSAGPVTTANDSRLTPGKTYYYQVRAYGNDGESSYTPPVKITMPRLAWSGTPISVQLTSSNVQSDLSTASPPPPIVRPTTTSVLPSTTSPATSLAPVSGPPLLEQPPARKSTATGSTVELNVLADDDSQVTSTVSLVRLA